MKNKNFGRKRQAIYILSNRKSTRIIKTLMDFFFFIKVKIKMVCFSVPSLARGSSQIHHIIQSLLKGLKNFQMRDGIRAKNVGRLMNQIWMLPE